MRQSSERVQRDGNKRLAVEDLNQPCCHCDQCDTLLHLVSPVRQSDHPGLTVSNRIYGRHPRNPIDPSHNPTLPMLLHWLTTHDFSSTTARPGLFCEKNGIVRPLCAWLYMSEDQLNPATSSAKE
ncbi:hypothetical protein FOBRF1_003543 [Fusarium oxysporum]